MGLARGFFIRGFGLADPDSGGLPLDRGGFGPEFRVARVVGQDLHRFLAAYALADELAARLDHELLRAHLAANVAALDDLQGVALDGTLYASAHEQAVRVERALEAALAANRDVTPTVNGALDATVDMELALEVQFADESRSLSDNRGASSLARFRLTALAKESHLTPSSCVNSAS